MTQHIGIVAVTYEGASLCYRSICAEAAELMGDYRHPEITLHSLPLRDYLRFMSARDWRGLADLLLDSADHVARSGADFAICPANTVHEAFKFLEGRSPIPWLHIAEVVADRAAANDWARLGILGTSSLMEGCVYTDVLSKRGMEAVIPTQEHRDQVNAFIFEELVKGVFRPETREYFRRVVGDLTNAGCDAVVMGCTEIPLILDQTDVETPLLDSTRILGSAALERAVAAEPRGAAL